MTIENDIDALVSDVTIRKAAVVKAKGDLDAILVEGASAAGQAEGAALAALSARDESSAMATASEALATASVGATAYADLAAVAAAKVEDAVDVFIYDTSLDSDGGAWRYRTQGTSWYREALNTANRGSRREFPAMALIVAESNKVTIYDGDDPALPMWMVFGSQGYINAAAAYPVTSTSAKNSKIVLAQGGAYGGVAVVDLLADGATRYRSRTSTNGSQGASVIPVSGRNEGQNPYDDGQSQGTIVNETVNDVAMAVLPNAPIDPATSLPVPTIAVATDGGVSVIKDDGAVVDLTKLVSGSVNASRVVFLEDGGIAWSSRDVNRYIQVLNAIPDADYAGDPDRLYSEGDQPAPGTDLNLLNLYAASHLVDGACAGGDGVTFLAERPNAPEQGMVAYCASTYATGWMPGDIKGAWLADTDEGDLGGAGANPDNVGVYQGSYVEPILTASESDARVRFTFLGLTIGKWYEVTGDVQSVSSGSVSVAWNATSETNFSTAGGIISTSGGPYSFVFQATQTFFNLIVKLDSAAGATLTAAPAVLRLADADRSVNAKGLIVNGRVRRAPVADGAELMAYSGFSAENYLEQPYNADLDFGTGDFAVMGWFSSDTLHGQTFFELKGAAAKLSLYGYVGNFMMFGIDAGGNVASPVLSGQKGAFVHITFVRKAGVAYFYANGQLIGSSSGSRWLSSFDGGTLRIGTTHGDSFTSYIQTGHSMALLRITATAPSADQIARIYNDERALFEPGAACTLYGDSDAVTALAHDKVTNLLHVGTSAGRSVFDGLRRVAHTTSPVGNAIAAHNGLIIEG